MTWSAEIWKFDGRIKFHKGKYRIDILALPIPTRMSNYKYGPLVILSLSQQIFLMHYIAWVKIYTVFMAET